MTVDESIIVMLGVIAFGELILIWWCLKILKEMRPKQ